MRTHRITMFGFCVLAGVACGSTGRQGSTLEQDAAASAGESASSGGGLGSSASVTNASGDGGTSGGVLADAPAETPDGGGSAESGPCSDSCPQPNGLTVGCETRFLYGVNYAWKNWVADFGGVSVWGQKGVSQNQSAIMPDLMDMQANGVDVIRWWMLQKLEGDAITFDSSDTPTGTGGTLVADIQAALLLATTVGVHYNFTIFSFDDFAPSGSDKGATIHGMADIITDATKRAALMNVVKTIARTVEASPQKDRVVSWDVINEPEWAISGSDPYGDMAFSPNTNETAVTFAQMETFVSDAVKTLHANSSAPVTVGGAAVKWAQAWSHVGLDFYTFHMYDWVNQYFPFEKSIASYGVTGKPTVMGEFPLAGLAAVNSNPAIPLDTMLAMLPTLGYAGAMPWAVDDTCCGSWSTAKATTKSFAASHVCQTHY